MPPRLHGMLKIFIYGKNEKELSHISKCVGEYCDDKKGMTVIYSTCNQNNLLEYIDQRKYYGLYVLGLPSESDINSNDFALEIRKHDPRAFIVFVAENFDFDNLTMVKGTEIMDYVEKNACDFSDRLHECIAVANDRYRNVLERDYDKMDFKLAG